MKLVHHNNDTWVSVYEFICAATNPTCTRHAAQGRWRTYSRNKKIPDHTYCRIPTAAGKQPTPYINREGANLVFACMVHGKNPNFDVNAAFVQSPPKAVKPPPSPHKRPSEPQPTYIEGVAYVPAISLLRWVCGDGLSAQMAWSSVRDNIAQNGRVSWRTDGECLLDCVAARYAVSKATGTMAVQFRNQRMHELDALFDKRPPRPPVQVFSPKPQSLETIRRASEIETEQATGLIHRYKAVALAAGIDLSTPEEQQKLQQYARTLMQPTESVVALPAPKKTDPSGERIWHLTTVALYVQDRWGATSHEYQQRSAIGAKAADLYLAKYNRRPRKVVEGGHYVNAFEKDAVKLIEQAVMDVARASLKV